MSRPLFRDEALQARRGQWLGRIRLVRPLSLDLVTLAVLLAAAAVATFIALAPYTRKATAEGALLPDRGLIRIVPAEAARVVERRVDEGQRVRRGDVLFVLALDRARLAAPVQADVRRSLDDRERSLQDAARQQGQLAATQGSALERRLQALDGEGAQIEHELALQRQRLALAEQALARLEQLRAEQFIAEAQVLAKKEEVVAVRAQLQAMERQRAALGRERALLEGERRSLPLQSRGALGAIERERAALAREAAEQDAERQLVVRAPQDGQVAAVLAEPGQAVSPASALASLVPEGATLQAQVFAPSSAIGFVQPGQPVRLRIDAYPYAKFGALQGRVLQVSRAPLAAAELATQAVAVAPRGGQALFRITVALDDESVARWPHPLTPGLRLQADLMLERRRLVEWLFEPLFALGRRL